MQVDHRRALCIMLIPAAFVIACATGTVPCGLPMAGEYAGFIADHEAFPGELSDHKEALTMECRQGKMGLWIGIDTFRIAWKSAGADGPATSPPYKKSAVSAAEQARKETLQLLGFVYMDELFKKPGTIHYDLSLEAFNVEMKPFIRKGKAMKREAGGIVFQIEAPCLKDLVYAKTVTCKKQ